MTTNAATDFEEMFELAPVSLWLEDYSGLFKLFESWRAAGVTNLRSHLRADLSRVRECTQQLKVLKVNRRTLDLFEASDFGQLVANLDKVFGDATIEAHIVDELVALWDGKLGFSSETVNFTLTGQRVDIIVNGSVLPAHANDWSRVLVAIEDITERKQAGARVAQAERYARGLFEDSPVSLWVEDFSLIKRLLDDVRARGIDDFRVFTQVHPEFVERCMTEIRVIDVNQRTLEMFDAPDKPTLLKSLDQVFRDEMVTPFTEQLIDLWNGKLMQHREVINYKLNGELINVLLQLSVLPGAENDWSLVQVGLIDITARKKAEAYLEYLGKHDVLTRLRNRAFFEDELNRLERKGPWPVTIVAIDLNRLKATNDASGHAAGDALLRRAGEVLGKVSDKPTVAARIGGDEFVLVMPGADERAGEMMVERVASLVELNNQYYPGALLSLAVGCATAQKGERLETTVSKADERMFRAKHEFYSKSGFDRRTRPAELS
jgi:diguanylate cyclase (GGDEF)-like protein